MENEIWLSVNEYAAYRSLSISTIRRYLKSGAVHYKKEDGKYYILTSKERYLQSAPQEKELMELKFENQFLNEKIKKLEEENNDLKMLVHIYEKQMQNLPPEIPATI